MSEHMWCKGRQSLWRVMNVIGKKVTENFLGGKIHEKNIHQAKQKLLFLSGSILLYNNDHPHGTTESGLI